jgi:hypothetical protein
MDEANEILQNLSEQEKYKELNGNLKLQQIKILLPKTMAEWRTEKLTSELDDRELETTPSEHRGKVDWEKRKENKRLDA